MKQEEPWRQDYTLGTPSQGGKGLQALTSRRD